MITNPFCSVAGMNNADDAAEDGPVAAEQAGAADDDARDHVTGWSMLCPAIVVDWKNARLSQPANPASRPDRA